MKRLAGMTVLVAIAAGLSVWAGSQRANAGVLGAESPPATVSSTRLLGRRLRCTASVRSEVEPGQAVSVRLSVHNRSKRAVEVRLGAFSARVVLRASDGTAYDSSELLAGLPGIPPPLPTRLRPGKTLRLGAVRVPVRWSGPLRLTPECLGKPLPALRVTVAPSAPPADQTTAVDEVVAASAHLLDQCRPQTPGVSVYGQIDEPTGATPPLDAQCSLTIGSEGTFWVAQVLVLVPSDLAGVQVFLPYETLWPTRSIVGLKAVPPYEAIAWQFVVTAERAIPVAAATLEASNPSSQKAPSWVWTPSGFHSQGSDTCGGTGFTWGGRGPEIDFISACPATP